MHPHVSHYYINPGYLYLGCIISMIIIVWVCNIADRTGARKK